jgi:protein-tyrosine phosphatase
MTMNSHPLPFALLDPAEMPSPSGLSVPLQFYLVTREPAPLAGMPYPGSDTPWQAYYELGLSHVVSLHNDPHRPYNPAPLAMLSSVHLQDLYNGLLPLDPKTEEELLSLVVGVAKDALQVGQGVLVHCAGGIGRTGTLIGCLLASLGYPASAAIDYLHRLNRARGYRGWPESPWQAAQVHRFSSASPS